MAKQYLLRFGSGDPTTKTGLTPTLTVFKTIPTGTAITAPGITQIPSGTGLFYFTYATGLTALAFVCDGGATLSSTERYIVGNIDPVQQVDEQLTALGTTMQAIGSSNFALGTTGVAIGNTLLGYGASIYAGLTLMGASLSVISAAIGTTASSFGSTSVDPGTLYGYLKRMQEFNEGNSTFTKSTGAWDIYSRGSSTLLTEKILADSGGVVSKT